jgi:hypothetical protein
VTERRFTDDELERALRDVGAHLAYPPTADLLPAVRSRIERSRAESFWATLWSPRLAFVPAAATIALLIAATLAFQPVGARAADALGLRGLAIFFGAETPPPSTAGKAILPDATRVASLEAASREVGFTVRAPTAVVGEPPDEVYVRHADGQAQAILVYRAGASGGLIRSSAVPGVGMLIIETRGRVEQQLLGKVIPPGTRVEQVTVSGGPGVWIEGEPHQFFYRGPDGNVVIDSLRLAGNVLAWEQDGLLLRIESQLDRATALKLAAAMR